MVALAPDAVVSNGKTAAQLGGLTTLNETEFTALSQPVGSTKPGVAGHGGLPPGLKLQADDARCNSGRLFSSGRTRFCVGGLLRLDVRRLDDPAPFGRFLTLELGQLWPACS